MASAVRRWVTGEEAAKPRTGPTAPARAPQEQERGPGAAEEGEELPAQEEVVQPAGLQQGLCFARGQGAKLESCGRAEEGLFMSP